MKRSKKMLLLLLALVLCVGGYYGVQMLNQTDAVTEESGTFPLESRSAENLAGLTWADGDETFSFVHANGAWTVSADPAFPLNQEDMQGMAEDLLALAGTRQLDGVTDLAAYGLAEPAFSVTASWTDGTSTTYAMGAETPFGDGYYISLGHEGIVYTVEEDLSVIFDTTLNALAVMETLPEVSAANRLSVGSALDIVKEETSRTINAGELWYDNLTGAALDATAAQDLITAAQGIAWDELVQGTSTDEELAGYGVDEETAVALTLYEGENAALTLLVGAQNDEGDYYARLPGSTMVYTVAGDSLSSLMTAAAEAMPSMVIMDLAAEKVQSAAFTAGDHSYTWTPVVPVEEDAAEEEAAEAASDEAAGTTETAAGADTTDEASAEAEMADPGAELWADILALKADSRIAGAAGSTLLTVEVTSADGLSAVMTFTEYDAEHYAVSVLDRCFLVDAGETDAIIRSLRTIK